MSSTVWRNWGFYWRAQFNQINFTFIGCWTECAPKWTQFQPKAGKSFINLIHISTMLNEKHRCLQVGEAHTSHCKTSTILDYNRSLLNPPSEVQQINNGLRGYPHCLDNFQEISDTGWAATKLQINLNSFTSADMLGLLDSHLPKKLDPNNLPTWFHPFSNQI